jgi:hypothetical protein
MDNIPKKKVNLRRIKAIKFKKFVGKNQVYDIPKNIKSLYHKIKKKLGKQFKNT